MSPGSHGAVNKTFAHAVDALCLSREDIAHALGLSLALLDAYASGAVAVPPMTELELVDVVKARESLLAAAAGSLYEESMARLERSGLTGPFGVGRERDDEAPANRVVPSPSPPSSELPPPADA